jgi:hypothetical protein
MFNIHALREQWDLLTIALKLPRVIDLLRQRLTREPNEAEIASETGLIRAVVRRARLLMQLPTKYQQMILLELKKPKHQQKLTEDFFIEMERSLTTVERNMPEVLERFEKDDIRDVLIKKYTSGTVGNLVHLRQIARIARAEKVEADVKKARQSLEKLFARPDYTIERAYEESVGFAYGERDLTTRVVSLTEQLRLFDESKLDEEVLEALQHLLSQLKKILGAK